MSIPCHIPELEQKVASSVAIVPPRNNLLPVPAQAKVPREPEAIELVLITRGWMFSGIAQTKIEHSKVKPEMGNRCFYSTSEFKKSEKNWESVENKQVNIVNMCRNR